MSLPEARVFLRNHLYLTFPVSGVLGLVRVGGYWLQTQVPVGEAAQMVRHWNRPSCWVPGLQKASTV